MTPQELYEWYYEPGEVMRSIGFYINPYDQWKHAKFRHIFAFDGAYNLYVGQYSVYQQHFKTIFDDFDKREYGFLHPREDSPVYSEDKLTIHHLRDAIEFEFMETRNITYLNRRLKKICQRLYDYGMPKDTVITSTLVDLWNPTINDICKGQLFTRDMLISNQIKG